MDHQAKLQPSTPLNPTAEEFRCRPPLLPLQIYGLKDVEQVVAHTHPLHPHQIYGPRIVEHVGEHTLPLPVMEPMSSQEMWYPYLYAPCQPTFLPDFTWAVTVYPPPLPSSQYQPLGPGLCDTSLHQREMSMAEERTEGERTGQMCMERHRQVRPAPKRVQAKWRVKVENKNTSNTGVRPISPFPETLEETERSEITTVMIRNVPNQFRLKDVLKILDCHCYIENLNAEADHAMSKYDFVYLPMDYRRRAIENRTTNLGYAFVNFTTCKAAFKFYLEYHGYKWQVKENRKTCEIARAALQGKEELKKRLQKIFRCPCFKFLPVEYFPPRDGLNQWVKGSSVGKYVRGLPGTKLGSRETESKVV